MHLKQCLELYSEKFSSCLFSAVWHSSLGSVQASSPSLMLRVIAVQLGLWLVTHCIRNGEQAQAASA